MNRLTVAYFALFREQTGCGEEVIESDAQTVAQLFEELRQRHASLETFGNMKFALNDEIVGADAALADGDRVLFFPPVAGG